MLLKNNEKCREKMDTAEEKAALVALKAVLWLVLEDLPLSKYSSLMKLLKELEVPFVDKLNLSEKTNYESYDSAMEFLNALCKSAEDSLRQKTGGGRSSQSWLTRAQTSPCEKSWSSMHK